MMVVLLKSTPKCPYRYGALISQYFVQHNTIQYFVSSVTLQLLMRRHLISACLATLLGVGFCSLPSSKA